MKKWLLSCIVSGSLLSFSQDKKPYQVFDKNGKKASYEKILKAGGKSDVILFGEYHNNSVVHWLQLELTKDLAKKKKFGFRCRNARSRQSNASESIFK